MSTNTPVMQLVKPDGTDLVNEGTHLNNNWDKVDLLPQGELGYVINTSQTNIAITTEVDLTGMSVTVTVTANRRIKITGQQFFSSTVASDVLCLAIKEGTTQLVAMQSSAATGSNGVTLHGSVIITPSAGVHTYKLSGVRVAGSGTMNTAGAPTVPNFLLVEDMGAV